MHSKYEAEECLRQMLGVRTATFKEGQWEAIDAVVNQRKKLIVVQKTGWGKSAVYFISTYLNRRADQGLSIIISPLLALMRNQIQNAERVGLRSRTINSDNTEDWESIKQEVLANEVDILFISPERLANEEFMQDVLLRIAGNISLFVVDEVHCISDWGHDFRPDYKRISQVLRYLPYNTPIIGTTATANERVIRDVQEQFGAGTVIQRGQLTRETLSLDTVVMPDRASRLVWLAHTLRDIDGCGIVYVLTQNDAETVSEWLNRNGISAFPYYSSVESMHEGLGRERLEDMLLSNEVKALVATSALGMGFDKPDIRFVIHYQVPGNVIAYYQQVGRAGRGVPEAGGILLAGREDAAIQEYFRTRAFPTEQEVSEILEALEEADGLKTYEIGRTSNLSQGQIERVLKYLSTLENPPIAKRDKKWYRLPVKYVPDREKIAFLTHQREQEWAQMEEYVRTPGCKMQFLAKALDNDVPRCGKCSSCLGRHLFTTVISDAERVAAALFLNKRYAQFTPKIRLEYYQFQHYPFMAGKWLLPKNLRHETGWILSRWGENELGQLVLKNKHEGKFSDELVDAFVRMLQEKGVAENVSWVTCVPSVRHPGLVPDFARRAAEKLRLPFYDVIQKVRDNQQQKGQQNTTHRLRNLDGVFAVEYLPMYGAVLLIDDIYDSGWTLSVISALLLNEGASAVYPATLSSASSK